METKHTPGPWGVDVNAPDFGGGAEVLAPSGEGIALVWIYRCDERSEELCQNARLIAAAPDLLDALIKMHEMGNLVWRLLTDDESVFTGPMDAAEAAISKALGVPFPAKVGSSASLPGEPVPAGEKGAG